MSIKIDMQINDNASATDAIVVHQQLIILSSEIEAGFQYPRRNPLEAPISDR